jgi:hypothetical protein
MLSDASIAALIAVGGVVVTSIAQLVTTRLVVRGDLQRMMSQLRVEALSRRVDTKRERLFEILAECLTAADPELHIRPDYGVVVRQIHRAQLLLDVSRAEEHTLALALNDLGLAIGEYLGATQAAERGPERDGYRVTVYRAMARVTESAQRLIAPLEHVIARSAIDAI